MFTFFRLLASAAFVRNENRPAQDTLALLTFTKN
jgi:hypothetical protein